MVEVQGFSLFYLAGEGPMSCQLFFTQMHPIRFFGVMERMMVTSQHLNMNLGMFSLVLYAKLQGVRFHVGIVLTGALVVCDSFLEGLVEQIMFKAKVLWFQVISWRISSQSTWICLRFALSLCTKVYKSTLIKPPF